MTTDKLNRVLFIFSLSAIAFSLAISVWLLSFFTIMTLLIWIWDGGPGRLFRFFPLKKEILLFSASYFVYVIWMINTSDISFGLKELRIKLPLIIFPFIIGLSAPLNEKEMKLVFTSFISGIIISSLYGVIHEAGAVFSGHADSRALSPFVSHIRLALMDVFGIFSALWFANRTDRWNGWRYFFLISALWMLVFLFLLLSLTGIVMLILTLFITIYFIINKQTSKVLRILFPIFITGVLIITILLINAEVKKFYTPVKAYILPPVEFTAAGGRYSNNMSRKDIENGNRVWIYLCEDELRKEWKKSSSIPYDSLDRLGQNIRYTLIRYLSSAGLTKDSAGFSKIGSVDLRNIESGITNREFTRWSPWKKKIYELIWQIDYYRNGGNPSGHSLTQRLEFLKTGWHIFKSSPFFGIGTGDIASAYASRYAEDKSKLEPAYRLLAHNQFLTFLISFGIAGTLLLCIAFCYPFFKNGGFRNYLSMIFFIIIFLSMFWEDTLETHTGITFFAYFYSVFIFGTDRHENKDF